MELPEDLEAWTLETVLEAVRRYEYEPARVDFKEVLHTGQGSGESKKEHTESVRRTIASMANTDGGHVLFGVLDRGKQVPSADARIVGIPLKGDLRKEVGEKLQAIQRPVQFDVQAVPLPSDTTRGVLVVQVPLSPLRPHMVPQGDVYVFYRRDSGGHAIAMNYFEVRDQMLVSEQRMRQVTLLRLELRTYRRLATALRQDAAAWFIHLDSDAFKTLLANICDLLPADGMLLENLHLAATLAGGINDFLRAGYTKWDKVPTVLKGILPLSRHMLRMLRTGGEAPIAQFDLLCAECEQALEKRFGPLIVTTVPEDARDVLLTPTTSATSGGSDVEQ